MAIEAARRRRRCTRSHYGLAPRRHRRSSIPRSPAPSACGFRVALPLPPGRARRGARRAARRRAGRRDAPRAIDRRRASRRLLGNVESPGATRRPPGAPSRVRLVLPSAGTRRARRARDAATRRTNARTRSRGPTSRARSPTIRSRRACGIRRPRRPAARAATTSRSSRELESGEVACRSNFQRSIRVLSNSARRARRAGSCARVRRRRRRWPPWDGRGSPATAIFPARATGRASRARRGDLVARGGAGATRGLPGGFEVPPVADRYDAWLDWNRWTERRAAWLEARLAVGGRAADDLDRDAGLPPRPEVARSGDRDGTRAGACAMGALHRRRRERRPGADAPPRRRSPRAIRGSRSRRRAENGNISLATNSAAELATGDFLLFLDQDDELAPDALGEIALALAAAPDADILYTDDDKIDVDGRRYAPQFKPDWSPELLLSYMYFSHALVVRRTLFADTRRIPRRASKARRTTISRCARPSARAGSSIVPLVLYHWRATPGSTAISGRSEARRVSRSGVRAVDEALARRGSRGRAVQPGWAARGGLGHLQPRFPGRRPARRDADSHEEPSRRARALPRFARTDDVPQLRDRRRRQRERRSGHAATTWPELPHRVLRVANPGPALLVRARQQRRRERRRRRVSAVPERRHRGPSSPRWLSSMMGYAQLPGRRRRRARGLPIPTAGSSTPASCTATTTASPVPRSSSLPGDDHGYLSYLAVARNYGAVTAACMLTPRRVFPRARRVRRRRASPSRTTTSTTASASRPRDCAASTRRRRGSLHHEGAFARLHRRSARDRCLPRAVGRAAASATTTRTCRSPTSASRSSRGARSRRAPPGPVRALMCAFNLNWEGAPYSQFEMTAELKRRAHRRAGRLRAGRTDRCARAYEREGIPVHVSTHPLAGVTTDVDYDAALDRFRRLDPRRSTSTSSTATRCRRSTRSTPRSASGCRRSGIRAKASRGRTISASIRTPVARRALACYDVSLSDRLRRPRDGRRLRRARYPPQLHRDPQRARPAPPRRGRDRASTAPPRARRSASNRATSSCSCSAPSANARVSTISRGRSRSFRAASRRACAHCSSATARATISARCTRSSASCPTSGANRVTLVPETGDVARYFIAADVFVCTSRVESYPRVILEAMAWGLPIITTPVFGIREQVRENVNGLFYEPGDVEALASRRSRASSTTMRCAHASRKTPFPSLDALTDFDAMVDAIRTDLRRGGGAIALAAPTTRQRLARACAAGVSPLRHLGDNRWRVPARRARAVLR